MKNMIFSFMVGLLFVNPVLAQQITMITPKLVDLGRVKEGDVVEGSILFVNAGDKALTIKQVKTSCGCTAANAGKMEHAPGDTAVIDFQLNSRGYGGIMRKPVTVFFEEKNLDNLRYLLQADVFSEFGVNPRYINLGRMALNPDTVVTEFFTMKNESGGPIECKKIYVNKVDMLEVFPTSVVIPPGKEQLMRIDIKPQRAGRFTYYVHIQTDYEKKPRVNVPVFVYIQE
jgi:hypothetical protein